MKRALCGLIAAAAALALPALSFAQAARGARALELSREYMDLMQPEGAVEAAIMAHKKMMPPTLPMGPELEAAMREAVPVMIEQAIQAQARIYSIPELEALVRFYKTPEGRSIAAKTPQITEAMGEAQRAMMAKMMPKLVEKLAAEMCAKDPAHCVPK